MTEINLLSFCAQPWDSKHLMAKPFNLNGWTYALNGHVGIRVPATGPDTVPPEGERFPPASSVFVPVEGERIPWPERLYCPQCFDTGTIGCNGCQRRCDDDGCTGCGKRRCRLCNGRSPSGQLSDTADSRRCIDVGEHWIDVGYDDLIRELRGVTFIPISNPSKPLPFFFEGGEGRVMGVSRT